MPLPRSGSPHSDGLQTVKGLAQREAVSLSGVKYLQWKSINSYFTENVLYCTLLSVRSPVNESWFELEKWGAEKEHCKTRNNASLYFVSVLGLLEDDQSSFL